jgi:hypothetical protein
MPGCRSAWTSWVCVPYQRHLRVGDRAGVWQIRCELEDDGTRYCRQCGAFSRVRSSWSRRLAHVPVGQSAAHSLVRVRRYECAACERSWRDDLSAIAPSSRRMSEAAA